MSFQDHATSIYFILLYWFELYNVTISGEVLCEIQRHAMLVGMGTQPVQNLRSILFLLIKALTNI
jgi:hypothetical protein